MHRFEAGDDVIVTWIDSGMGATGVEGRHVARLFLNTTHGRVSFYGSDPELHAKLCTKRRCSGRCVYLELAMCSAGASDERADLAGIWALSIVDARRVR